LLSIVYSLTVLLTIAEKTKRRKDGVLLLLKDSSKFLPTVCL